MFEATKGMLDDVVMTAASRVLFKQFRGVLHENSFQDTMILSSSKCPVPSNADTVGIQFHHMPSPLHWVVTHKAQRAQFVQLYDSASLTWVGRSKDVLRDIYHVYEVNLEVKQVNKQPASTPLCGDYAIATAVAILHNVADKKFDPRKDTRQWLLECLRADQFTPLRTV
jgi:hypothetical protein